MTIFFYFIQLTDRKAVMLLYLLNIYQSIITQHFYKLRFNITVTAIVTYNVSIQ